MYKRVSGGEGFPSDWTREREEYDLLKVLWWWVHVEHVQLVLQTSAAHPLKLWWRPTAVGTGCQVLPPSAFAPRPWASSGLRKTPPSSSKISHPCIRFCLRHQRAVPDLLVAQSWANIKWFETSEVVMLFGEQISPLIIFCKLLAVHAIPHIYFCTCSQPTDVVIAEVNPRFRNLGQKNCGFSFSFLM